MDPTVAPHDERGHATIDPPRAEPASRIGRAVRGFVRERLDERDRERIDVRGRRRRELGRDVVSGARDRSARRVGLGHGDTEVRDANRPVGADQDVLGLEVAMDQSGGMRCGKIRSGLLDAQIRRQLIGIPTVALYNRRLISIELTTPDAAICVFCLFLRHDTTLPTAEPEVLTNVAADWWWRRAASEMHMTTQQTYRLLGARMRGRGSLTRANREQRHAWHRRDLTTQVMGNE
jgi:hypothetical protein